MCSIEFKKNLNTIIHDFDVGIPIEQVTRWLPTLCKHGSSRSGAQEWALLTLLQHPPFFRSQHDFFYQDPFLN